MIKGKKGWVKILEAFISVVLIIGVALIIINQKDFNVNGSSQKIYDIETSILREIQLNNSLRSDVLNGLVSPGINSTLNLKKPTYLDCQTKICGIGIICDLSINVEKNIYVRSVIISSNTTEYNPKQLKLFCWAR